MQSGMIAPVFGLARPSRHELPGELHEQWQAHLCGLCLGLRDDQGQIARATTNVDAVAVSVLVEAQLQRPLARSEAGRCPLRGMQNASVIAASEAANAHAVGLSLTAAAVRLQDHAVDEDGVAGRAPRLAARVARSWERGGRAASRRARFDSAAVMQLAATSERLESSRGMVFEDWVRPTEDAYAAAFGHTGVIAGCPQNVPALERVGRMFGRLTYLLDHVNDERDDVKRGRFNALVATYPDRAERRAAARRLFLGAHAQLVAAFEQLELTNAELARVVIADVLGRRGRRAVGLGATATCSHRHARASSRPRPRVGRAVALVALAGLQAVWEGKRGTDGEEAGEEAPEKRASSACCCCDCCECAACCECATCCECCD
jgi:hypothetical protein